MKEILFQLLHEVNNALYSDYDVIHALYYFNMREKAIENALDRAIDKFSSEQHIEYINAYKK